MDEKLRRQMQTLDRLYKESDRIGDDYAAHFGMNNTAFWVLYTLSRADKPVTQNDLREEWFFPAQTINSAVSGLVKKELVRLEPIPGTRNRKSIVLTEAVRQDDKHSRRDRARRDARLHRGRAGAVPQPFPAAS